MPKVSKKRKKPTEKNEQEDSLHSKLAKFKKKIDQHQGELVVCRRHFMDSEHAGMIGPVWKTSSRLDIGIINGEVKKNEDTLTIEFPHIHNYAHSYTARFWFEEVSHAIPVKNNVVIHKEYHRMYFSPFLDFRKALQEEGFSFLQNPEIVFHLNELNSKRGPRMSMPWKDPYPGYDGTRFYVGDKEVRLLLERDVKGAESGLGLRPNEIIAFFELMKTPGRLEEEVNRVKREDREKMIDMLKENYGILEGCSDQLKAVSGKLKEIRCTIASVCDGDDGDHLTYHDETRWSHKDTLDEYKNACSWLQRVRDFWNTNNRLALERLKGFKIPTQDLGMQCLPAEEYLERFGKQLEATWKTASKYEEQLKKKKDNAKRITR